MHNPFKINQKKKKIRQTAVCDRSRLRFFSCVQYIFSDVVELMSCEELHAILHLVLQAGNIMNAVSPCCC